MRFQRIPRRTVLGGGAAVVTAVVLAGSGIARAAESEGPVIYLSRHGAPTQCDVSVEGIHADGSMYKDSMHRDSCDGTLWMPELRIDTDLKVSVHANQPQDHSLTREFTVLYTRNYNNVIDNQTAICFLVKSLGKVVYTNMSAKGGECNGA